jgi:hypothetical protein
MLTAISGFMLVLLIVYYYFSYGFIPDVWSVGAPTAFVGLVLLVILINRVEALRRATREQTDVQKRLYNALMKSRRQNQNR